MARRTHSTIDKLPKGLRDTLTAMVVDGSWPSDWPGSHKGKPTYDDLVDYCLHCGHPVSHSAVGRWAMQLRAITRMKTAGLIAAETMSHMTDENAGRIQKAAAEMATALSLEFMTSHDDYSAKQLKEVSQAIRDCASISLKVDKYNREQVKAKAQKAAKNIEKKVAGRKGIDAETMKIIREQIYGIYT